MRPVPVQVQELLARLVKPVDIADALGIVDDSGVADVLEAEMPQVKGRPRLHSWRAILALYVLSAIRQEGEAHVFHAQKVWWGLTEADKTRLGFSANLKHSTMDKYLNDLVQATSESVHPLTGEVLPPRVSVDSLELMNRLLRAAVRGVKKSPTQSIDSMPLETWSRRRVYKRDLRPLEEFADYGEVKRSDGNPVRKVSEPGWPIPRENGEYQPTLDPDARDVFIGSKNLAPSHIGAGFDCHIAADANALGRKGGRSFRARSSSCPGTSARSSLCSTSLTC